MACACGLVLVAASNSSSASSSLLFHAWGGAKRNNEHRTAHANTAPQPAPTQSHPAWTASPTTRGEHSRRNGLTAVRNGTKTTTTGTHAARDTTCTTRTRVASSWRLHCRVPPVHPSHRRGVRQSRHEGGPSTRRRSTAQCHCCHPCPTGWGSLASRQTGTPASTAHGVSGTRTHSFSTTALHTHTHTHTRARAREREGEREREREREKEKEINQN